MWDILTNDEDIVALGSVIILGEAMWPTGFPPSRIHYLATFLRTTLHHKIASLHRGIAGLQFGPIIIVVCDKKGEYYGYSDADKLFYVVHDLKWGIADTLGHNMYACSGLGVQHAQQVVPHPARGLQCGSLLIHGALQDHVLYLQPRSISRPAHHWIKRLPYEQPMELPQLKHL